MTRRYCGCDTQHTPCLEFSSHALTSLSSYSYSCTQFTHNPFRHDDRVNDGDKVSFEENPSSHLDLDRSVTVTSTSVHLSMPPHRSQTDLAVIYTLSTCNFCITRCHCSTLHLPRAMAMHSCVRWPSPLGVLPCYLIFALRSQCCEFSAVLSGMSIFDILTIPYLTPSVPASLEIG